MISSFAFVRVAALIVFVVCAIPAIAKADCGVHEIQMEAPKLLAIEAMPLTPENIDVNNEGSRVTSLLRDSPPFQSCPDDSHAKQVATRILMDMWRSALYYQNSYAFVREVGSGYFANAQGAYANSPACAPVYTNRLRESMFVEWNTLHKEGYSFAILDVSRREMHVLESLPYYAHAMGLWKATGAQMGISFPSLQENADKALAEAVRYGALAENAAAHVPDGVLCSTF